MGDHSHIEWTDATWSPTVGCSVLSPGCTNCYAMKLAARLERMGSEKYAGLTQASKAGPVWNGTVRLDESALALPLRWKKPRRIFVNSMSDLFHEDLPDEAIDRVFAVMALAPWHTYQILTKRAERMRQYMASTGWARTTLGDLRDIADSLFGKPDLVDAVESMRWPWPQVWLGVSVEDQPRADERIPHLLETPAAMRFLSCEPLLGPVDLTKIVKSHFPGDPVGPPSVRALNALIGEMSWMGGSGVLMRITKKMRPRTDWVIVGGESGPGARPMHPDWARSLRDQCAAAGVPFFFKQWGQFAPAQGKDAPYSPVLHEVQRDGSERCTDFANPTGALMAPVGKKRAGRLLDGREHNEFPEASHA